MDEEDFPSSDESDQEYVPSDGEKVSEEENSGEEEDFNPEEAEVKSGKRKRKDNKEPKSRKRKGGIKLEEEKKSDDDEKDDYNEQLSEQVKEEQKERKEKDDKAKADMLWADFKKDVDKSGKSSASKTEESPAAASTKETSNGKVTVQKQFDFAGEIVTVSQEVDSKSAAAKAVETKEDVSAKSKITETVKSGPSSAPGGSGLSRLPGLSGLGAGRGRGSSVAGRGGGGGLSGLLGKIGKKPKMSTLEKSKLDWEKFKSDEGIKDELAIHNRGKDGYIARKQFLERTDLRQFEIEKSLRQKNKKT